MASPSAIDQVPGLKTATIANKRISAGKESVAVAKISMSAMPARHELCGLITNSATNTVARPTASSALPIARSRAGLSDGTASTVSMLTMVVLAPLPKSGAATTDPRIDELIAQVDEGVDEQVRGGEDQHRTLQHGIVLLRDGLRDQPPDPGQREHLLDDHRAANEPAQVDAGQRDQRERRGTQRFAHQDVARRQTARFRSEDEILLQRGEHVGP